MKLNFEQIKSITAGAIRMEQVDAGIRFYKCTKKQQDRWYQEREFLGENASASTGVRLDFHTDSQHMSLDLATGNLVEIYLDGVLRYHYAMNDLREEGKTPVRIAFDDPFGGTKKDTHVTVYFPSHHTTTTLASIELDDGASITPHPFDMKILFLGDSITQGWDSGLDSLSFANRVSRFFNADSVIHGVGGAYFEPEILDDIPFDPDIVVVAYGTNDFYFRSSYEEIRQKCAAFLKQLADTYQARGKKVFVLSPLWRGDRFAKPSVGDFVVCRSLIVEQIEKSGLIHIDGLTLVPPLEEFFSDRVLHPNALGFSLYAENLISQMIKHL